jgi:hypothetical protein
MRERGSGVLEQWSDGVMVSKLKVSYEPWECGRGKASFFKSLQRMPLKAFFD